MLYLQSLSVPVSGVTTISKKLALIIEPFFFSVFGGTLARFNSASSHFLRRAVIEFSSSTGNPTEEALGDATLGRLVRSGSETTTQLEDLDGEPFEDGAGATALALR